MTIQNLRYFKVVAEYKSLTKAAQNLFISQPSLTHAIKELEKEFGVQLTIRKSRGFELTEQGKQFLEIVREYLQYTDYVERSLRSLSPEHRKVKIGMPPMLGSTYFPSWSEEIQKVVGPVEFQRVEGGSIYLRKCLERRQLDCAIIPWKGQDPDTFISIPLKKERYVCCLAKNHPLASAGSLSVRDLINEPVAILDSTFQNNCFTRRKFAMYNIKPNIVFETNQYDAVRKIVASGGAISFTFESYVALDPEHLVGVPLEEETTDQTICFMALKSRFQISPIKEILEYYSDSNGQEVAPDGTDE